MDTKRFEYALKTIHPTRIKILQAIANGQNTFSALMSIVSRGMLAGHLRFLLNNGFITKEGENKKVKYKITEKGEALLQFVEWFGKEYYARVEKIKKK